LSGPRTGGYNRRMKLLTAIIDGAATLGILEGERVLLPARAGFPLASLMDLIEAGPEAWQALRQCLTQLRGQAGAQVGHGDLRLGAPIPRPRKNIICLGLNYADHARESAAAKGQPLALPDDPVVFTKSVTTVIGPRDPIPAQPEVTQQLDWEVELGVIIGVGGKGITRARALEHVFGYTIINDVSARDLQFRHKQFFLGKSLDGTCPMGPVIVTADEIPDPQSLQLRCWVNGALKQHGHTRDQIFDIASVIATLSRGMRLEPGDIVSTGTPAGVGFARQPPEFLRPGDVVECEIPEVGRLVNRVV